MKTCHTGGAPGADSVFEFECKYADYNVIVYSFDGHNTKSPNRKLISQEELNESFKFIKNTNLRLHRNLNNLSPYVKNLLARDYYQVFNSDAVYAIGLLDTYNTVKGGTGYACSCAIDLHKPIYLFDQDKNYWMNYEFLLNKFVIYNEIPKLTENFAGIGTRDINQNGINAIRSIFKNENNLIYA
ncbi:hypothetical protein M0Q50_06985 [bacterium]|jgi:hypothetical protein|nr:hypothetical protein [bacterium]